MLSPMTPSSTTLDLIPLVSTAYYWITFDNTGNLGIWSSAMSEGPMTATEVVHRQDLWMSDVFIPTREKILRRVMAYAYFILQRRHSHCWFRAAEVVTVEGLGTRLQFSRWCYCGRRQTLIEWWNQFKEPCYHG